MTQHIRGENEKSQNPRESATEVTRVIVVDIIMFTFSFIHLPSRARVIMCVRRTKLEIETTLFGGGI
jgi:hypothetical protein